MPNQPFFHSGFELGLERLVMDKPDESSDLLDSMFFARIKSVKATIRELLKEIKIREELDIHLMSHIDSSKSSLNSKLVNLEAINISYMINREQIYVMKAHLRNNILELERQKRAEYLQCWHDLLGLKRDLLRSLSEFWDLAKKQEMISSEF